MDEKKKKKKNKSKNASYVEVFRAPLRSGGTADKALDGLFILLGYDVVKT